MADAVNAASGESVQKESFNADAFKFLPEVQMLVEAMANATGTSSTRDVTNAANALKSKFDKALQELEAMSSIDTTIDQQRQAYEERLRQLQRKRELIAKYQKLAVFARDATASAPGAAGAATDGASAPMETDA